MYVKFQQVRGRRSAHKPKDTLLRMDTIDAAWPVGSMYKTEPDQYGDVYYASPNGLTSDYDYDESELEGAAVALKYYMVVNQATGQMIYRDGRYGYNTGIGTSSDAAEAQPVEANSPGNPFFTVRRSRTAAQAAEEDPQQRRRNSRLGALVNPDEAPVTEQKLVKVITRNSEDIYIMASIEDIEPLLVASIPTVTL